MVSSLLAVLIATILGTGLLLSLSDGAFGQTGTPAPEAGPLPWIQRLALEKGVNSAVVPAQMLLRPPQPAGA